MRGRTCVGVPPTVTLCKRLASAALLAPGGAHLYPLLAVGPRDCGGTSEIVRDDLTDTEMKQPVFCRQRGWEMLDFIFGG